MITILDLKKEDENKKGGMRESVEIHQYYIERVKEMFTQIFVESEKKLIIQWYEQIVNCDARYVVFMSERSYLIALILEKITGKQMKDKSGKEFLSNSAIFTRSKEIAEYYQQHNSFLTIFLFDDIVYYGRNITHTINFLEKKICEILGNDVKEKLLNSIEIYPIVRTSDRLLISGKYETRMRVEKLIDPPEMHEMEGNFLQLIDIFHMAKTTYVMSEIIPIINLPKSKLEENNSFTKTTYWNSKQYTQVEYVLDGENIRSILTLSLLENSSMGYIAMPFVFLPNLDQRETQILLTKIVSKMKQLNYTMEEQEWIEEIYNVPGKSMFNELVTLILSMSMLNRFKQEYNISSDIVFLQDEIKKLVWRYNHKGHSFTKQFLERLIAKPLFDLEETKGVIAESIIKDRNVAISNSFKNEISFQEQEIVDTMEKYFWERAYQEEQFVCKEKKKGYAILYPGLPDKRSRGVCFTFRQLLKEFSKKEMAYGISYFLQMMNAEFIYVFSVEPRNCNIVGYAQFVSSGEQVLLMKALKFYEYIPMLAKMEHSCRRWNLQMDKEIDAFRKAYPEVINLETAQSLKRFVKEIYEMGHICIHWNGTFFYKFENSQDVRKSQKTHSRKYIEYVESVDH